MIHYFIKLGLLYLFLGLPCLMLSQSEICDNGIDDDNDALIDLNDDDCFCKVVDAKSLIPNPSFEELDCCPDDRSQLNCASSWIQASRATTDFVHQCGWQGWPQFPPPLPFPDGEGVLGFRDGRVRSTNNPEPNWKEYAGACLINPLLKDSVYRFQFDLGFVDEERSPPLDISIFGTSNCDNLPFGNGSSNFGCPSNSTEWVELGSVAVAGRRASTWQTENMEIIPDDDIFAIAIGPSCNATTAELSTYYYFDRLLLTNVEFFDLRISEFFHPCDPEFFLTVPDNSNFNYQWYLAGIALLGETSSELGQNYGEGSYQVRITDDRTCRVSAPYEYIKPKVETATSAVICKDESFDFKGLNLTEAGIYYDTLKTANNCDSIIILNLEVIGVKFDTVQEFILSGETWRLDQYAFKDEGAYELVFASSLGCDSLVLLNLSHFEVYIPNVFRPSSIQGNEMFKPVAETGRITSYNMQIFNRWGNLVYEGLEWNGGNLASDVFVYKISIDFNTGETANLHGTITLLE